MALKVTSYLKTSVCEWLLSASLSVAFYSSLSLKMLFKDILIFYKLVYLHGSYVKKFGNFNKFPFLSNKEIFSEFTETRNKTLYVTKYQTHS